MKQIRHPVLTLVTVAALAVAGRAETGKPLPYDTSFFSSETPWGDGNAEVAIYEGPQVRYGAAREDAQLRLITVREAFAPGPIPVKADDWRAPGSYNVIKQNQIFRIPTGTYRYDQMWSGFWRTSTGRLDKFSLASIDSCGNTYKQGLLQKGRLDYTAMTYWEGMTNVRETTKLPAGALFYNELPLKLRALDWQKTPPGSVFTVPLAGAVVNSKADAINFAPATITVSRLDENPDGPIDPVYWIEVKHAAGLDYFAFRVAPPHVMTSWQRADGGHLKLKSVVRIPYWQLNQPGDEKHLTSDS